MLPISVLLPTRDSGAMLPDHLRTMAEWIDLAAEVVAVDSHSKDDTVEQIKRGIAHPRLRCLTHPPGLYQSWNFGIQQAEAKYIYISTVGDRITRQGLERLAEVAEQFQSDVVISKPEFVNEAGQALPDDHWPIDEITERLGIKQPRLLTPAAQFFFAVVNTWGAILGSSASNLYRADCLKPRPFPIEYGTSGDGGWGIQNVFDVKIAVVPERFSTFRQHAKTYSLADYRVDSLALKFFRLAQKVAVQRRAEPTVAEILAAVRWSELEPALEMAGVAQNSIEHLRAGRWPWYLRPAVWRAREVRGRARRRVEAITQRLLADGLGRAG